MEQLTDEQVEALSMVSVRQTIGMPMIKELVSKGLIMRDPGGVWILTNGGHDVLGEIEDRGVV